MRRPGQSICWCGCGRHTCTGLKAHLAVKGAYPCIRRYDLCRAAFADALSCLEHRG